MEKASAALLGGEGGVRRIEKGATELAVYISRTPPMTNETVDPGTQSPVSVRTLSPSSPQGATTGRVQHHIKYSNFNSNMLLVGVRNHR
jgi:hypothetical protein